MFKNAIWLSGKATEDLVNNIICLYDSKNETVSNIQDIDDLSDKVFVFVSLVTKEDEYKEVKFKIHNGEYVRCMRVHVIY